MGIWVPLYVLPRASSNASDEYNNLIKSVETDKCLKVGGRGGGVAWAVGGCRVTCAAELHLPWWLIHTAVRAPLPGDSRRCGHTTGCCTTPPRAGRPCLTNSKRLPPHNTPQPNIQDSFHGTVLTGPDSGPPGAKDHAFFMDRFRVVSDTKQWTAFG
jgi:hypothetical protein